jgi:hypothetical protein
LLFKTAKRREANRLILALNETRKTLLASRLHVMAKSPRPASVEVEDIRPGDGVLFEKWAEADARKLHAPLDLVFLDANHRVLALGHLKAGRGWPAVNGAVSLLGLASGTIRLTDTRKGDHIVLEPIVPRATQEAPATRLPRA